MFVPDSPRFPVRWMRGGEPPLPDWLDSTHGPASDGEAWLPAGERRVYAYGRTGLRAAAEALAAAPRRRVAGVGESGVRTVPDDRRAGSRTPAAGESAGTALVPSYVARAVVWAFLEAGYDVRYYPVEPDLSLDPGAVRARLDDVDPAAVVFLHYFGFADPAFRDLAAAARDAGAAVVEDCARGLFARHPDGALLGSVGDVALFSLHKTLPVPHGGVVVAPDLALAPPVTPASESREAVVNAAVSAARTVGLRPSLRVPSVSEAALWQDAESFANPAEAWPPVSPGRLSRLGLARTDPGEVVAARRARYDDLRARLVDVPGLDVLTPPSYDGANPFGVAVRVGDVDVRNRTYVALRRRGLPVEVLRWPLIHRPEEALDWPGTGALRRETLMLPTHHQLPERAPSQMAATVAEALHGP